jgi:hypothetical protein
MASLKLPYNSADERLSPQNHLQSLRPVRAVSQFWGGTSDVDSHVFWVTIHPASENNTYPGDSITDYDGTVREVVVQ